ncbi:MAG TPA: hypothetical protein VM901_07570 [Bdellovibrionota bacterium]|jgi:hypothetical protein|nr:hypothetical protein [Bdellovibrionota bacterium]
MIDQLIVTQQKMPTTETAKISWHLDCSTGWTYFLRNLKAIVEHGIDLNT